MSNSENYILPIEVLAQRFERFGTVECYPSSPLYARLSLAIAQDAEILALAGRAGSMPVPNLFLSAVHYLLMKDPKHPLAAFFPDLTDNPRPLEEAYPPFRAFCLEHQAEIEPLIATRRVQTNEVRRCALLLPAFGLVGELAGGKPLALLEIGASAGLNLLWNRYGYNYGAAGNYGDHASPVQLACALRGEKRPPLPAVFPKVASRVGVDLNPVDVRDDEAVLWLEALIWPEHLERASLLRRAIELARQNPHRLVAGDALVRLPEVAATVPTDSAFTIFHSFTINQFPKELREKLWEQFKELSKERELFVVSIEWIATEQPQLRLDRYIQGEKQTQLLAHCDPHGQWLEWL